MKYVMRSVQTSKIIVNERYRRDYGDLEKLKESIIEKGVLQPICVDTEMNLLAGGRRYEACRQLGLPNIPCLIKNSEDEIDAREVELIENVYRKDMTWQEQASLVKKIHDLYTEKDPKWTQRKTAELINKSPMSINRALKLSEAMESHPDIAEKKTADLALKDVKKQEVAAITEELARRQKKKIEAATHGNGSSKRDPIVATLTRADKDYQIKDVFDGLNELQVHHKKFTFIECDPPFGLPVLHSNKGDGARFDDKGEGVAQFVDIDPKEYPAFLRKLCEGLWEVAADNSWMSFWFAFRWYEEIRTILEETGWTVNPVPAIWMKGKVPFQPYPDMFLNAYHPFFVCKKGSPHLMHERHSNVFYWTGEGEKHYHPHQRPLKMMEDLLESFVPPASHVLVPFLGSGMTLRACYNKGYDGIGFELDPQYKKSFMVAVEDDVKTMLEKERKEAAMEMSDVIKGISEEGGEEEEDDGVPF